MEMGLGCQDNVGAAVELSFGRSRKAMEALTIQVGIELFGQAMPAALHTA